MSTIASPLSRTCSCSICRFSLFGLKSLPSRTVHCERGQSTALYTSCWLLVPATEYTLTCSSYMSISMHFLDRVCTLLLPALKNLEIALSNTPSSLEMTFMLIDLRSKVLCTCSSTYDSLPQASHAKHDAWASCARQGSLML